MAPPSPLHQLKKGQTAHIEAIVGNQLFGELDGIVAQRLADLGFLAGAPVAVVATGWLGRGPFAVRIGSSAQFSLRQAEAAKILCQPTTSVA